MIKTKQLVIKKFGGTSLASIKRIEAVADRIVADRKKGQKPVIVVSAMAGETDRLARLGNQIGPVQKGSAYDTLLASGEQVSLGLMALALEKRQIKAVPLLAHQIRIKTNSIFSRARIREINTKKIKKYLAENQVPVVAGFQGVTKQNAITTLGKGGSDITALALTVALKQNYCEIFTDVPKIFTADPNLLSKPAQISKLSYEEMMEMSSLGSRILHCRSVEMAAKYNVRIHVRSTFENGEGTWIVPKEELMEAPIVSAVTHDPKTAVITMFPIPKGTAFIAKLFKALAKKLISVDVISQSYHPAGQRLAFSVADGDLPEVKDIIYKMIDKKNISIITNVAKLSIVGVGMANHPGVAARFFSVMKQKGMDLHLVTTSEIKISAIIDKKYLSQTAKALHKEFKLDKAHAI